jgi:autotransporter translocation and assembly factor TamB
VVRKRTAQEQAEATQTSAWDARFVGLARLKQGVIKPAAIGLELRDTNLTLRATREAEHNVVEIVELSGKAASEKLNLRGRGKLYFSGTELAHGWAGAGLDDVPFVVRGVRLADLTGQVSASFRQDPTQMSSRVEIPQLRVLLPRSTGRSLIDLTPNPSIAVLQPLSEATESSEPGLPWHVLVNLGDEVRVQSAALNVRLSGQPELILAEELEVDGKLLLPAGGRVTVAGKLFVIEHGFIQFDTGDHTDPHINIRAVWRAPGGVSITANLVGTAREPELTLESDPPLPGGEAEIFALLFGGGVGDTDSNAASPALGAGATFVSEILGNTALRGVELRAGVEKRGSSGQSSQLAEDEWRSYAAAVPLSDDVWFEGSYKTEQRATAADGRSGFSGTLDWRFKQDWALRTELGELGTAVDLLWQYRY